MFMSDKETFKLLLFFHGNGCNPEIISRWILLAQSWASSQATAEKEHGKYNLSRTTLTLNTSMVLLRR